MNKYFVAYNSVIGKWEVRVWINEIDSEQITSFNKEINAKQFLKIKLKGVKCSISEIN